VWGCWTQNEMIAILQNSWLFEVYYVQRHSKNNPVLISTQRNQLQILFYHKLQFPKKITNFWQFYILEWIKYTIINSTKNPKNFFSLFTFRVWSDINATFWLVKRICNYPRLHHKNRKILKWLPVNTEAYS